MTDRAVTMKAASTPSMRSTMKVAVAKNVAESRAKISPMHGTSLSLFMTISRTSGFISEEGHPVLEIIVAVDE